MACNDSNQPLLSGLVESLPQTNNEDAPNRGRRLRRCSSAPHVAPPLTNDKFPPPEFIIGPKSNFRNVKVFLLVYLVVGTICLYTVRSQIKGMETSGILDGIIDSVYFCIVTMTTIGNGDLVPNTILSKLLVCAFVFIGMALLVLIILSKVVEFLVKKHDMLLVNALETYQMVDLNHILKEIESETNMMRHKCIRTLIGLFLLIIIGTIVQVTVEKMDVVDAFYCICATISTLGYGDKSFSTTGGGYVVGAYWILMSTVMLALFFLHVAQFHSERRLRELVKWVLARKMSHEDLEA